MIELKNMERVAKASLLLIPLNLLDILTTYFALGLPNTAELNPLWLNVPIKVSLGIFWVAVVWVASARARKEDLQAYAEGLLRTDAGEYADFMAKGGVLKNKTWFKLGWINNLLWILVLGILAFYSLVLVNNTLVIFLALGAL